MKDYRELEAKTFPNQTDYRHFLVDSTDKYNIWEMRDADDLDRLVCYELRSKRDNAFLKCIMSKERLVELINQ